MEMDSPLVDGFPIEIFLYRDYFLRVAMGISSAAHEIGSMMRMILWWLEKPSEKYEFVS